MKGVSANTTATTIAVRNSTAHYPYKMSVLLGGVTGSERPRQVGINPGVKALVQPEHDSEFFLVQESKKSQARYN